MEKNTPKKVLQINAGSGSFGGVSAFIYNVYSHIDTDRYQFDFLSMNKTTFSLYQNEIEDKGGHIFEMNSGSGIRKWIRYRRNLTAHLKNHTYDIVHINAGSPGFIAFTLNTVKQCSQAKVITHVHSIYTPHSFLQKMLYDISKREIKQKSDCCLSCSEVAGNILFPHRPFEVLYNGIDLSSYRYEEQTGKKERKKWNLSEDNTTFCFAGRLEDVKNPIFALDVFEKIARRDNKAVLFMIGDGSLMPEIRKRADESKYTELIRILGHRKDLPAIYPILDVLIMPSKSEGLGMAAIEAQAAGLEVFASDVLPKETDVSRHIHYISLNDSPSEWAGTILKQNIGKKEEDPDQRIQKYDIRKVVFRLEEIYRNLAG